MQDFKNYITVCIIGTSALIFFYFLFLTRREIKLQKKFNNFALSTTKETKTLLDSIFNTLLKILKTFSKITSKSKLFNYLSKKYDKYTLLNDSFLKAIDYITLKSLLFIIALIICLILEYLKIFNINYVSILIISIFFYYLPNIILNMKKRDISYDIIDGIIMIDNNLKKGLNINNAIKEVIDEVNDTLKNELEQILLDLENGLSLDKAFLRFDKSVNINYTSYISKMISDLTLLDFSTNEIFSYLASNLKTKKIKEEKLLIYASGARIFYKVTVIAPIFITILLIIFKPDYFKIVFNNIPALLIFISFILIYISYIIVGKRLMKGK